jgi:microcystin-dependent protein
MENRDRSQRATGKRPYFVGALVGATIVGVGALVYASVPHTFAAGETLTADNLNGNFAALDARIAAVEQKTILPGTVIAFAGKTVPPGWLVCDGRNVDRTMYADLFAAVGVTYGVGDGVTTFGLPNYVGRFLMGVAPTDLGSVGGQATVDASHSHGVGTLTAAGGAHTHDLPFTDSGSGLAWHRIPATGAAFVRDLYIPSFAADTSTVAAATYQVSGGAHTHTVSGTTAVAGATAEENRPPFVGVLPLIKL